MKKYDLWGGLFWLLLGIGLCIGSSKLNIGHLRTPGPGFFSFLIGTLLGLLGLILIAASISKRLWENGIEKSEKSLKNWKDFLSPVFALLVLFIYTLLLEPLGFLVTTFLFLFVLFKQETPKKWLMPLTLSVITAIFCHVLFSVWLNIQFPKGIFKF